MGIYNKEVKEMPKYIVRLHQKYRLLGKLPIEYAEEIVDADNKIKAIEKAVSRRNKISAGVWTWYSIEVTS